MGHLASVAGKVRQLVRRWLPVDYTPPSKRGKGWILRFDGTPAPEDEEQEFRQAEVLDIVDFQTFLKRSTPRQADSSSMDIAIANYVARRFQ
jgi:hypothetical protein